MKRILYLQTLMMAIFIFSLPFHSVSGANEAGRIKHCSELLPLSDEIYYVVDTIYIENPKVIWWEGNAIVVDSIDIPKHFTDFKEYLDTTNFYFYIDLDDLVSIYLPDMQFKKLMRNNIGYNLIEENIVYVDTIGEYKISDIRTNDGDKVNTFLLALVNLRWLNYCEVYSALDGKSKPFKADYELNIYVKGIDAIPIKNKDGSKCSE